MPPFSPGIIIPRDLFDILYFLEFGYQSALDRYPAYFALCPLFQDTTWETKGFFSSAWNEPGCFAMSYVMYVHIYDRMIPLAHNLFQDKCRAITLIDHCSICNKKTNVDRFHHIHPTSRYQMLLSQSWNPRTSNTTQHIPSETGIHRLCQLGWSHPRKHNI